MNRSFEQRFEEECEALRAPKVALEFQGRSGRAERRKVVAQHRPSEILSEGEQKVLAIADFLAESRMRGTKAPIVLDDPVTSLDYRRLEEVSHRVNRLAETHQVIVFTHNIMFASSLIALRNKKSLRCKFYEVRDGEENKGLIAPDVEPRLDTPADIAKRIGAIIDSAKKGEATVQDALVERGYDLLRAWCEAFIEQELLNNVTQRYRANIMMTRLAEIKVGKFAATATAINAIFDKACRCMGGHSHPPEQLNVRPTLADLSADWAAAQKLRADYLAKWGHSTWVAGLRDCHHALPGLGWRGARKEVADGAGAAGAGLSGLSPGQVARAARVSAGFGDGLHQNMGAVYRPSWIDLQRPLPGPGGGAA